MSVDIARFVENYKICQENKIPRTGPEGLMGVSEKDETWSIVACDIDSGIF